MKYVEIVAAEGSAETIISLAEKVNAADLRVHAANADGQRQMRMLVADDKVQQVLDILQTLLGAQPAARIVVLTVEASLPSSREEAHRSKEKSSPSAREAIYEDVTKGARLDGNFIVLVILSTVVAVIGLIENNVAVVIGAMVIAPLLGPNLALSLGTALGDMTLTRTAIKTLVVGISLALILAFWFGFLWPTALTSYELLSRTHASFDSIALALASGAAAALSVTTGLSGVLVGVMVAVALLPPAVTMGVMLGQGQLDLAEGAGLLLAINIVSVNLASKLVFFYKGIRPRTWLEKTQARQSTRRYLIGWGVTLIALSVLIYLRGR